MSSPLHQLDLILPGDTNPRVFSFWQDLELPNQIASSTHRLGDPDNSDWLMRWLVDGPAPGPDVLITTLNALDWANIGITPITITPDRITVTSIPDTNWLAACYQEFSPTTVGTFYLYGSHEKNFMVPPGTLPIRMDAVTAFGSGTHGTTGGCLLALGALYDQGLLPACVLDLGSGSGILSIAAASLWRHAKITAIDNDPEAIKVTTEYAALNHCTQNIICILADHPKGGPYDLIVANILAGPLRDLAGDIVAVLSPHGTIILSGLLESQCHDVIAAYTPFGLRVTSQTVLEDWVTLVIGRI
jgi:ribosomal protein L11 methyltransferase